MEITLKELNSFNEDQEIGLNKVALNELGGIKALENKLKTNFVKGLSSNNADIALRQETFGRNEFPEPESTTWIALFLESFEDTTIIVLMVAAVVSLAIGIYEDPYKGWIEGAAILFAVLIVAVVTATNNYNKELQFRKLNAVKDDISIGVMRHGQVTTINVKELVVGDLVLLNAGDKVPADGLLVDGSDVTCDESSLTGESEDKKKSPPSSLHHATEDAFLLSGTSLSTGYAKMLVTSVGIHSRWGKTKAKLATESADTPLQEKLDSLAGLIGNFGMGCAVLTFLAMMGIYYAYPDSRTEGETVYEYLLKAFIMSVTIVVVAVPEGLPLAVTLSLAYSTQKMMKDNNLIRVLAACETMGNATTICSDKTGTLTLNKMTIVTAWLGERLYEDCLTTSGVSEVRSNVPKELQSLLSEGIAVNTTANLVTSSAEEGGGRTTVVVGSKTEGALLLFLQTIFGADYTLLRPHFQVSRGDRLLTFSSARKRMSVILCNGTPSSDIGGVVYTKGASEIVLARCTHYINGQGGIALLTPSLRQSLEDVIGTMAKQALRTVCLAHRMLPVTLTSTLDQVDAEVLETGLVLDGIVGIKDPLRPEVRQAVRQCQAAGIVVRMVTGDNLDTAKAIALECGIYTPLVGGLAMEGPAFRKLTPAQLDTILPNLQVLARSSPQDKHTLVTRLNGHALPETHEEWSLLHPDEPVTQYDLLLPGHKAEWLASRLDGCGEVVGVTGDGSNDGPALKAADVGLSMGLSGTDVAKEASDIVILDDNFSSIVKSVMWGRAVFDNIRKFLQFQLTVNVVALTVTFLCALTGREPPLNAVMMLWVNLIMDTMGALALGTEPPSTTLLQRKPYKRNASLISTKMWRHITLQSLFQLVVLGYLLFVTGATDFQTILGSKQHITIVFNTFVFCQIFNEINARSIGDEGNVFAGLLQNPIFLVIIVFTAVAQVGIVNFGGDFVRTAPMTLFQWQKSVTLAALTLPVGGMMRWLPVAESAADFAPISPLLAASQAQVKAQGETETPEEDKEEKGGAGEQVSGWLWLVVVSVIPAVVWQQFGQEWTLHCTTFLASM